VSEGPVLVVGGTGRTGRLIAARLVERGVSVRALVRDAARGLEVLPPDVTQYVGDVRRSETLKEPVAGARAVVIATCSSGAESGNDAESVDYYGTSNLIEQAAAAGVEWVMFISTIHATRPEHYQDVEPTSLGWKARWRGPAPGQWGEPGESDELLGSAPEQEAIHAPDSSGSRLDDGANLLPQAQITEAQAIRAAQTAASGPLNEVDLEDYQGHLVFNVDVGSHDVKVDASNGNVLAAPVDD